MLAADAHPMHYYVDQQGDTSLVYTFCIDGGGSKTLLQVIDSAGRIVPLTRNGETTDAVVAGASNINVVKKEGVQTALHDLFDGLFVDQKDCKDILSHSKVVAGLAGVSISENQSAVTALFKDLGIQEENLLLLTDGELALRLLQGNGIILISGTGSICFAKKEGIRQRVGGLGRILGDEGSGYQIGLDALRAGLAEEFGYGEPTLLTPALRSHFAVAELKSLFPQINSLEMPASAIAAVAPLVFETAPHDSVAASIIASAAKDLRQMVATALKISQLTDCELYLWGGTFKGAYADAIIDSIRAETDPRRIKIVNQSSENAALIFARTWMAM